MFNVVHLCFRFIVQFCGKLNHGLHCTVYQRLDTADTLWSTSIVTPGDHDLDSVINICNDSRYDFQSISPSQDCQQHNCPDSDWILQMTSADDLVIM